jgi:glutamyl-tRNA synthetase/glutamyl-Q tRNA(Asp) synthetase
VIRPDLASAASRWAVPPVTRFAPSPTGYLHLGHVANAIYVWGLAQALGGTVLVRVEDHDRVRSRPEFETALLEDLAWLGLAASTSAPVSRQSDRGHLYDEALARLRTMHEVYVCDCSRRDTGGGRYQGRCRDRALPEGPGTGLRVRFGPGAEAFDDLLLGRLEQRPADQCGDLLIRDRDGHWTYHFAVTVDDICQRVTLVVRGQDLVSSTGRQLRLAHMLSGDHRTGPAPPPTYLHHPLIMGPDGRKLSKSTGAAGVRALRRAGLSPKEVIGRAAAAVGLQTLPRAISPEAVGTLFAREELGSPRGGGAGHPARAGADGPALAADADRHHGRVGNIERTNG